MKIGLKRTDNLVIVVINDQILQRIFSDLEEDKYNEMVILIDEVNSGLIKTAKKIAKKTSRIRILMNARKSKEVKDKLESEARISEETFNLAKGDDIVENRYNDAVRITAIDDRFEHDTEGLVYMKGNSVPMPRDLVKELVSTKFGCEPDFTEDSLLNFWNWAVLNPNPEARNDLFGWFKTGSFTITEDGLVVAYRAVNVKNKSHKPKLQKFVNKKYTRIKFWKKAPKNYVVIDTGDGYNILDIHKKNFHEKLANAKEELGNLRDLYEEMNNEVNRTTYTDNHTRTFEINMGEPVSMPRKDCDEDRNASCSSGLHFMSKKYGLSFGDTKIIILINPMNIVAFPSYDNTKGRCCEYLPVALADTTSSGSLKDLPKGSFSFDYADYTKESLERHIKKGSLEQLIADGEISSEVSEQDFKFIREDIKVHLKNKVVSDGDDW